MLGKLIKYEFKATCRLFLPIYGALIIISFFNRLLNYLDLTFSAGIFWFISVLLIFSIFVVTLIITIQRFNKNLLSNEGYLMLTLPVKIDFIILSKLLVAGAWAVLSFFVVQISISILLWENTLLIILGLFSFFGQVIINNTLHSIIYLIEYIIIVTLSLLASALLLYACLSLGMLVNKHRGIFSFGAFILITTVMQIISWVGAGIFTAFILGGVFDASFETHSGFQIAQSYIWAIIMLLFATAAIFYLITRYMLKNRLNLH